MIITTSTQMKLKGPNTSLPSPSTNAVPTYWFYMDALEKKKKQPYQT